MNVADTLYSGTIAAAMEATLQGVPAIAPSQRNGGIEQMICRGNGMANM